VDKDDFWSKKKEQFLQNLQQQGFDLFGMQDFLEQKGLPSIDEYIIKDNFMNP